MIGDIAINVSKDDLLRTTYWDVNRVYSFDEYIELEIKAPFKGEFRNGKYLSLPQYKMDLG